MAAACPLCANVAGNRVLADVPEMQIGLGESFDYMQCGSCGALSLLDLPQDMSRYYPADYYSLTPVSYAGSAGTKKLLKLLRTRAALGSSLLAQWIAPLWLRQLSGLGLRLGDPVLDVGCGNGARLSVMHDAGFTNLHGIDPYLAQPCELPGLKLMRCELGETQGSFRLVMFHHSFEHLVEPELILKQAAARLHPGGVILIRTPLADSYACEHYGKQWAQLDAPRHLHVHTRRSIELMAAQARLELFHVVYDSTAFQFWGSEQYRLGITLESERSWLRQPDSSPFSLEQVAHWEEQARRLNREGRGDQAALYLRHASR